MPHHVPVSSEFSEKNHIFSHKKKKFNFKSPILSKICVLSWNDLSAGIRVDEGWSAPTALIEKNTR